MRVYKNARKKKKKKLVETAAAKSTIIKKLQNCDFFAATSLNRFRRNKVLPQKYGNAGKSYFC